MLYRHEVKHLISPGDAAAIQSGLRAVARLDPHAAARGYYCVRSLYFDDPMDSALYEKLDGVNMRRKFRLRYYDGDLSYLVLECKMKRDGVGVKPQLQLSVEEASCMLHGDTAWMVTSGQPLLMMLYTEMKLRHLRPRTVVEYRRIPYVYAPGNVRVTIDWNLRTGAPSAFLKPDGLTLPTGNDAMLLEVKWDEYLPAVIRDAVAVKSRQPTAFSKYAASRVYF